MTPEEFYRNMMELYGGDYDEECAHADADALMCAVLRELGYNEGVDIFERSTRWYA